MPKLIKKDPQEDRYRVLIENAPEAIVILNAETGKFIDCNHNATEFFKLSRADLFRKGPVDLSPDKIFGRESASYAQEVI